MIIGTETFTDDRTIETYIENKILLSRDCTLDNTDMTAQRIQVHECTMNVQSGSGVNSWYLESNLNFKLISGFDYEIELRADILYAWIVQEHWINPHDVWTIPSGVWNIPFTTNVRISDRTRPYDDPTISIRITDPLNQGLTYPVVFKLFQIVPETRIYTDCNGEDQEFNQEFSNHSSTIFIHTNDFGDTGQDADYGTRDYDYLSVRDIPSCSTFKKFNQAQISAINNIQLANIYLESGDKYAYVSSSQTTIVPILFDEVKIVGATTNSYPGIWDNDTLTPPVYHLISLPIGIWSFDLYTVGVLTTNPGTVPIYISIRYNYEDTPCDCDCEPPCPDGKLEIKWTDHCGDVQTTLIKSQIHKGSYKMSGEGYTTFSGEEIHPILYTKSEYVLSIMEYSDAIYQGILYLIATNKKIEVNGVEYSIKKESFDPSWDNLSQFGDVDIILVKNETLRTIKRGCCE